MTEDEAVERAALVFCQHADTFHGGHSDNGFSKPATAAWEGYSAGEQRRGRTAVRAILAALRQDGYPLLRINHMEHQPLSIHDD